MNLAPIIVFCYSRVDHLKSTLEALSNNPEARRSQLYVYSDAARNANAQDGVRQVRAFLRTISGFEAVNVLERDQNWGIEKNMVDAIKTVGARHGRFIAIEDDVVTAPGFLALLNGLLERYENDPQVMSVTGFNYPPRLFPVPAEYQSDLIVCKRNCSYGWASWHHKLSTVEWDFKSLYRRISAENKWRDVASYGGDIMVALEKYVSLDEAPWDYTLCLNQILDGRYTIYPRRSFVNNIGFDDTGLHSKTTAIYDNDLSSDVDVLDLARPPLEAMFMAINYRRHHKLRWRTQLFVRANRFLAPLGLRIVRPRK